MIIRSTKLVLGKCSLIILLGLLACPLLARSEGCGSGGISYKVGAPYRFTLATLFFAKYKTRSFIVTGANPNSTICILNDVSGSMGGGGGPAQKTTDTIRSGAPGAQDVRTGSEAGIDCSGAGGWSLIGAALDRLMNGCCSDGCNLVVISDGCSNHRNPWIANADQDRYLTLMGGMSGSTSGSNVLGVGYDNTMQPPGYYNGASAQVTGYSDVPSTTWNANFPPTQAQIDQIARTALTLGASAR